MTKLNDQVKDALKKNVKAKAELMVAFSVTEQSVNNWLKNDSYKLTTPAALEIISTHTGLKSNQILEK